jgi:hypothetical protein
MSHTIEDAQEELRQELILTDRWYPLRYNHNQALLFHHPARFKACASGRRSGKTENLKRHAVTQLPILHPSGKPRTIGIGAPTATRVRKIYFDDIRALIPKAWLKSTRESLNDMEFRTHWGAVIRLVGLGNPKVVEGTPWSDFYTDETPDTPPGWIKTNLRPALGTKGYEGRAWFIGVPDEAGTNQAEYEKIWEDGLNWPKKDYCSFWWPASDIVEPEEFQSMSEDMDEFQFRQEMLGLFVSSSNKALPNFDPVLHVDDHYSEYCPFLPLDHTFDFGVRPAVSLVGQSFRNSIWIIDEINLDDSSTDVACREFIARAGANGWDLNNGIRVFGDAAGRTPGQNIGVSDYEIIREEYSGYKTEFHNLIANPEIKDTVNAVRRRLMDRFGNVRLYISHKCKRLREEMKTAPWPDRLEKFHALAALRYYVYALSSFGAVQSGITGVGRATITTEQRLSARYTRRSA